MKKNKKILVILLMSIFVVSCGNTQENAKTEGAETASGTAEVGAIDISEYIEKPEELVELLNLEKIEGSEVAEYTKGLDAYKSDDFRLEYEDGRIYLKSDGNENINAFGIKVGISFSEAHQVLEEHGFFECEEGGPAPVVVDNDYLKIVDNEPYYLELSVVDDKVAGWYFTNTENCQGAVSQYLWNVYQAQQDEFWQTVLDKKYAQGVTLDGDDRDNNKIKTEEHILLPKSEVLIVGDMFDTYDVFDESKQTANFEEAVVDLSKEDIEKLIVALESAKVLSREEELELEELQGEEKWFKLNFVLQDVDSQTMDVSLWTCEERKLVNINWIDAENSSEGKGGKVLESPTLYEMIMEYGW